MVRITEGLVRKRAEHNEMEISSLEEVSLHQQDIEKIEYLDKWCRDLRILYLQSNLIEKIENVSRLKKLEYLNVALNNIERIENLEGCESLEKLDLTVNFVGELTSIKCLKNLEFMRELYLTGNPCTEYNGYRDYVMATLPQLTKLDGVDIEKSERIQAIQNYHQLSQSIERQQKAYLLQRAREVEQSQKSKQKNQPGFDGRWYTDINSTNNHKGDKENEEEDDDDDNDEEWERKNKEFWDEKIAYTPESRKQVHEHMKKARERGEKKPENEEKRERKLFSDDGRAFNVNEAKVDFSMTDDEENNRYVLDISAFKHMDTSLMDADVHPTYVRVLFKGKIFQLCVDDEVIPSSSTAQRSTTTGHLVITMPKAGASLSATPKPDNQTKTKSNPKSKDSKNNKRYERLEVDPSKQTSVDFGNIVKDKPVVPPLGTKIGTRPNKVERENSPDFIDDPDVPPLM